MGRTHPLVTHSTAFHPRGNFPPQAPYNFPPDIVLRSLDNILFYAHRQLLEHKSHNAFSGSLANDRIVDVHDTLPTYMIPESASVLNCLFHILYVGHQLSHPELARPDISFGGNVISPLCP